MGRWPSAFVDFVERAGVSAIVSGDASPFASETQAFFDSVSADSVVAAMELRRVPFHARLVSASGATASWTAESQGKPISRLTLAAADLEPRKVAAIVVVSDELLNATQGEAVIQNDLKRACSDALDSAFLSAYCCNGFNTGRNLERRFCGDGRRGRAGKHWRTAR